MQAPLATVSKPKKRERLHYFDYFRALAILFIIFGHSYNNWQKDEWWEIVIVNVMSGGTALFVFISGFFFHHIYYAKFQFGPFLKKKTLYVFLPYLILSILFLLAYYIDHREIVMTEYLHEYFGAHLSNAALVVINLLTGRTQWAYWYVPFIMLVFLMSPVFIPFIRLTFKQQVIITASLFTLSLVVQRPHMEINPFHALIYFVPYYLLGIIYSLHREQINPWLKNKAVLLFMVTVGVALAMALLGQISNMGKQSIWAWNGIDGMVFQKLTLIAFMLSFTLYLQKYTLNPLKKVAEMSFALFFLHPWVLYYLRLCCIKKLEHGFVTVLMIFAAAVVLTSLVAIIIHLLLGKRSRYVIGW